MWADPVALAAATGTTLSQATNASVSATWLLNQLTGNRYHGFQCWVDDYKVSTLVKLNHLYPLRGYRDAFAGTNFGWSGSGPTRFDLKHSPVIQVFSVSEISICSNTVGTTGFGTAVTTCYEGRGRVNVSLAGSGMCSTSCSAIRVHYKVESNLPPGADTAAFVLASEYLQAVSGGACMLPDRITSITRQGVTWTTLDPASFLKNGLTGVSSVDQWISTSNQGGIGGFIDPMFTAPLLASTILGCGSTCTVVVP